MISERYVRNIPAISEGEMEQLRKSRVLVLGCGGLGGYVIEYLSRLGIGTIRCVDGDVFCASNLNRQILSTAENLGTNKAEAARKRVTEINPDVTLISVPEYITEENAEDLMENTDLVIDALDNIKARFVMEDAAEKAGISVIHGAIEGWNVQCMIVEPGSRLLHKLYVDQNGEFSKTSLSMTAAFCAAMECALAVKVLLGRDYEAGHLYVASLQSMDLDSIPLL